VTKTYRTTNVWIGQHQITPPSVDDKSILIFRADKSF